MADFDSLSVLDALNASIAASTHLEPKHAATVGAARALAAKIDAWDTIVQWALEDAAESESRPKVPANDNTSLGTYSRYLEQLGLTVATSAKATGARKAEPEPTEAPAAQPGKVSLSMIRGSVGKTG